MGSSMAPAVADVRAASKRGVIGPSRA